MRDEEEEEEKMVGWLINCHFRYIYYDLFVHLLVQTVVHDEKPLRNTSTKR